MKTARRNYTVLLLLALMFIAPGLSAYIFYTHPHWLGTAPTNKGSLLNPPVLLEQLNSNKKWQLIVWSPEGCQKRCIKQLDKIARIRLALGRHLYEVKPVLLLSQEGVPLSDKFIQGLREKDIQILTVPAGKREITPVLYNNLAVFIANPTGYLVLSYRTTAKPDDIFHDLKQLITK